MKLTKIKVKKPSHRRVPFDYAKARNYEVIDPPDEPPPFIALESEIGPALAKCMYEGWKPFRTQPRPQEPRAKFVIHPSSAGGCPRRAVFSTVEAPDDGGAPDSKLQRIFDVGHFGHERIQGYLFECWRQGRFHQVWEDVRLTIPGLHVSGELDAIVATNPHHRYLVEIKTASRKSFDGLAGPKDEWLVQSYLYMAATNLRAAIILVECKDSQRFKEFYLPWDPLIWADIEQRLQNIIYAIEWEELPQGDTDHCYFCPYHNVCEDESLLDWDTIHDAMGF